MVFLVLIGSSGFLAQEQVVRRVGHAAVIATLALPLSEPTFGIDVLYEGGSRQDAVAAMFGPRANEPHTSCSLRSAARASPITKLADHIAALNGEEWVDLLQRMVREQEGTKLRVVVGRKSLR
jgi:hypothetical protein